MDRRTVLQLSAFTALASVSGFASGAQAQQKITFKASDVHPEGYPTVAAVKSLSKKLEAATDGRLSVQMYAAMQLGG
jgi:TRAP-type C4-dicarboxylate transport system substrate-binding protein